MARRHKGRVVDGVLLLDKPKDISSNHVVQQVRRIYQAQKVGHGGTLDPFATGLLPILLGEATKFGRFLLNADKTYEVMLSFGEETDTDDCTGKVIRKAEIPNFSEEKWRIILEQFTGIQQQVPPIYSALKIDGKRAYALARKGHTPIMESREITIYSAVLREYTPTSAVLRIKCSKGTYIRALVRDIGRAFGSAAYTQYLRRCSISGLPERYYTLDDLLKYSNENTDILDNLIIPLDTCVQSLPRVNISDDKLRFFLHGNDVELSEEYVTNQKSAFYHKDIFLGIGNVINQRAYPERLCHTATLFEKIKFL